MAFMKALLLAGTLAASVTGRALVGRGDCAAPDPTEEQKAIASQMRLNETMIDPTSFRMADVNIPVYIHVVAKSKDASGGYAKEADVRNTIKDMNADYKGMGFRFTIKKIDWTVHESWSADGDEMAMKKKLRKGDYKTLNLYFIQNLGGPNGYCYFPTTGATKGSENLIRDGCSIQTDKMTNGQTTTHEVGHWLGLWHTFQNGCDGKGDEVDDTPACVVGWDCNESLDTCPDQPGNDPVHNFMSYGTCREQFTAGQGVRMRSQYDFFRS